MKLTRKSDCALRLLGRLALHGEGATVTVRALAEAEGLSAKFLQGIAGTLAKADILISATGSGGGVRLSRAPENITILEVIHQVEESLSLLSCLEDSEDCSEFLDCRIHEVLDRAQNAMLEVFARTSIRDLIHNG